MYEDREEQDHSVFKNNPIELKDFVQKYVELKTIDGKLHLGTVYTIDPVSESVILMKQKDGHTSMDLIMGHAVKSLELKPSTLQQTVPEEIFLLKPCNLTKEEVDLQRSKLKNWLCKNRIPIEEEGEVLKIKDIIEIHPPYGEEQCISGNEIILGRVQHLISTMSTSTDLPNS